MMSYSLDPSVSFDPFELDMDITPDNILKVALPRGEFLKALVMALHMGEYDVTREVVMSVPEVEVLQVAPALPLNVLPRYFDAATSHVCAC